MIKYPALVLVFILGSLVVKAQSSSDTAAVRKAANDYIEGSNANARRKIA